MRQSFILGVLCLSSKNSEDGPTSSEDRKSFKDEVQFSEYTTKYER